MTKEELLNSIDQYAVAFADYMYNLSTNYGELDKSQMYIGF